MLGGTVAENAAAFRRIRIRTRVLRPVDGGDTRLDLLGHELAYPILLAPVALHKLAHAEGELATVLAAAAMQAPMIVSAEASVPFEDIAADAPPPVTECLTPEMRERTEPVTVKRFSSNGAACNVPSAETVNRYPPRTPTIELPFAMSLVPCVRRSTTPMSPSFPGPR